MAREKKDRTGETTVAKNGMKMTIIVYRNNHDMDVQFEDGAIRNKVQYNAFKIGNISHPNELRTNFNNTRIGDISVATNGMKMTVIEYRRYSDIDIQFEDGAIRKGVCYINFKKGTIRHPNELNRVGETSVAKNGLKMTIIAYRSATDIDVQFEDGAVRKGVTYQCFIKGEIRHPKEQKRRENISKKRVGETSVATNGMEMTIIAYRRCDDIDIQFEDGAVRRGVSYSSFQKGAIRHPKEQKRRGIISKNRVGETSVATNGMKMTIITYQSVMNIEVQFEDGAIRKEVTYACFKKGNVRHPKEQERRENISKKRVGETSVATNGMTMTIIAYRRCGDMDVQFEDGAVRRGVTYRSFIKGEIRHPSEKDRTGETAVATNGMTMTIIAYRRYNDIDVQFEDGAVRRGVLYGSFQKGQIRHPKEQERRANLCKTRLDETSVATNGMTMTIKAYRNASDIDIQFEDGAVRKGVDYDDFKNGNIRHPKEQGRRLNLKKSRIGETSIASNGMTMTITAYRKYNDIDIKFKDGAIRKGVDYDDFKSGHIRHPKEQERRANLKNTRIGETSVAKCGQIMTIVEYINYNKIVVQFDDKLKTRVETRYSQFKTGDVKNPNRTLLGKTVVANNGQKMTVVEFENYDNFVVQFNDKLKTCVKTSYSAFSKGEVRNPNYHIGETQIATNGQKITIEEYNDYRYIIVNFKDDTRVKTTYSQFKTGKVKNPHFPMHGKGTYKTFETQYAYTTPDGSVYFYCECQKCGWKKNLTARELINMKHKCSA